MLLQLFHFILQDSGPRDPENRHKYFSQYFLCATTRQKRLRQMWIKAVPLHWTFVSVICISRIQIDSPFSFPFLFSPFLFSIIHCCTFSILREVLLKFYSETQRFSIRCFYREKNDSILSWNESYFFLINKKRKWNCVSALAKQKISSGRGRSLSWPQKVRFWALFEPLNSPKDSKTWSMPVNISQWLLPHCVASYQEKKWALGVVGAYHEPQKCVFNQFWALLEPLNGPGDPETWSIPVNISQWLLPHCVAS